MKKRSIIKRSATILLAGLMVIAATACSSTKSGQANSSSKINIDKLTVYFVPSKEPQTIITATEPLKDLLKKQLSKEGYNIGKVDISVGTSYEAVGEALSSGTADIGFIPGGTYVLYDDGADVILTATRAGLNKDSSNPKDWNDGKPTETTSKQTNYYRALIIAGPTAKGKELAAKVNSGEKLTYADLASANWSIMSSSSSAGYIYPSLWMQNNFGKSLLDLPHVVQADSYGSSFARLASGQADVVLAYADARMDYANQWTSQFGRTSSIWNETSVIGVTDPIYNDTISVSKKSKIMTPAFKAALQKAFIAIAKTPEGKKVIAIYSHQGYVVAKSSDYDKERAAQKLIQKLNSKK
jgi:phosphonate transport system substrate-binding protein